MKKKILAGGRRGLYIQFLTVRFGFYAAKVRLAGLVQPTPTPPHTHFAQPSAKDNQPALPHHILLHRNLGYFAFGDFNFGFAPAERARR